MKLKIILSVLVLVLTVGSSYASFPVIRTAKNASNLTTVTVDNSTVSELTSPAAATVKSKDMLVALLLWFFLGGFAGHRWYLGSPTGWNILFILTLGGVGVWAIIDLIDILTEKYPGL